MAWREREDFLKKRDRRWRPKKHPARRNCESVIGFEEICHCKPILLVRVGARRFSPAGFFLHALACLPFLQALHEGPPFTRAAVEGAQCASETAGRVEHPHSQPLPATGALRPPSPAHKKGSVGRSIKRHLHHPALRGIAGRG